jgi:hypothetical protein
MKTSRKIKIIKITINAPINAILKSNLTILKSNLTSI